MATWEKKSPDGYQKPNHPLPVEGAGTYGAPWGESSARPPPSFSYIYAVSTQVQCPCPPALRRRGYSQGFPVLSNRSAGDLDTFRAEDLGDPVVGEHGRRRLALDQGLDARAHRFGGVADPAFSVRERAAEEVAQLEQAARRREILVRGHAAHRALVHLDRVGDLAPRPPAPM